MKRWLVILEYLILALLPYPGCSGSTSAPNILAVVIDDLGWNDVSWHDETMYTPNLQQMAEEGIILDRFYVSPTCTPSRSQFMTGRYNIRTGMQDSVIHSTEPRGVPLDEKFIAEKLQHVGYKTAQIGKWHLGMHMESYTPLKRGFDHQYGILTGGGGHTSHQSVSQTFYPRGTEEEAVYVGYNLMEEGYPSEDNFTPDHSVTLYSAAATKLIAQMTDESETEGQPWFMYFAHQAIHDPIEADTEYITDTTCHAIEKNANKAYGEAYVTEYAADVSWSLRPTLCAMMAMVDQGLGDIRDYLTERGEWDNTVVVFFSDNGGVEAHGSWNGDLRGEKGYYSEGGVRVPAFIGGGHTANLLSARGVDPYTYDDLVHVTDMHHLVLDLAAYSNTADRKLDGVALLEHLVSGGLTGTARTDMVININSPLFANSGAVISGDYKLVVNHDPRESTIYSKVRKRLKSYAGKVSQSAMMSIVDDVIQYQVPTSLFSLYNIKKNPQELDNSCDTTTGVDVDIETCMDLYSLDEYGPVRQEVEELWSYYADNIATETTFQWADDGPLADPANFGSYWTYWRDDGGYARAQYFGLASPAASSEEFYDGPNEDGATTTMTMTSMSRTTVVAGTGASAGSPLGKTQNQGALPPLSSSSSSSSSMPKQTLPTVTTTAASASASASSSSSESESESLMYSESSGVFYSDGSLKSFFQSNTAVAFTAVITAVCLVVGAVAIMAYRMGKRAGYSSINLGE